MKQDDIPNWLKEYQEMFPEKSPMQKQIDELKAKVTELEKQIWGRKISSFWYPIFLNDPLQGCVLLNAALSLSHEGHNCEQAL